MVSRSRRTLVIRRIQISAALVPKALGKKWMWTPAGEIVYKLLSVSTLQRLRRVTVELQVQDENPAEIYPTDVPRGVKLKRSRGENSLDQSPHKTCLVDAQTKAWKKRKIPPTPPVNNCQETEPGHD